MDSGDEISFDQNGDPYPSYDLVNWQKKENGSFFFAHVGEFSGNENLRVNEHSIIWQGGQKEVNKSKCITILREVFYNVVHVTLPLLW